MTKIIVRHHFDTLMNGLRSYVIMDFVCKNMEEAKKLKEEKEKRFKAVKIIEITE